MSHNKHPPPPIPQPDLPGLLWDMVEQIPAGHAVSYGQLAAALGDKSAARWVATELLHHEPRGRRCPCFRVIRQGGDVGSYAHGDAADKRIALATDGVTFDNDRAVGPWWDNVTSAGQPFQAMRTWQHDVATRSLAPSTSLPDAVAGMDISYTASGRAVAACVVLDRDVPFGKPAKRLWEGTAVVDVTVPYVTGYLVFRELPALLAVYDKAVRADVWPGLAVIDGSGRLHPRQCGVATCFSNVTGEPSIGVIKKSLVGSHDSDQLTPRDPQPVFVHGEQAGTAMQSPTGGKPVFVSPGEGISQADADKVIRSLMTIHRVPEPIYWADRISRQVASEMA